MNPSRSISAREIATFLLQLSLLLRSGIPILTALNLLSRASRPALAAVADDLESSIRKGSSYSQAVSGQMSVFGPAHVLMARVGEQTGCLAQAMSTLAQTMLHEDDQRRKLVSSLIYPACVLLASLGVLAFMVYFMLPRLLGILGNLGERTPWLTGTLLGVATGPVLTVGLPLGMLALGVLVPILSRTEWGRRCRRRGAELPLLGGALYEHAVTRFCRQLAMLLDSGVDLHRCLLCLRGVTTGLERLDQDISRAHQTVVGGSSLSEAFEKHSFPRLLAALTAVGEETSSMPRSVLMYAQLTEERLQARIQTLLTLLEPLLLVTLGIFSAAVVLTVFLPVYQLLTDL